MTAPATGPVLVAGAGPAGLLCAIGLAARGTRCRVVDLRSGPEPGARCPTLWQRSLEVLAAAGVPMGELLSGSLPLESKVFHVAGATVRVDLRSGEGPYGAPLLVPQEHLERLLRHRLGALGVEVEYGTEVLTAHQEPSGTAVAVLRGPAGPERVRVPWLVSATGGRHRPPGAPEPSDAREFPGMRWVLADVRVESGLTPSAGEEHIFREATGHAGLVPLPGGGHRLFLALPDEEGGPGQDGAPTPETVAGATERAVGLRLDVRPGSIWSVRPRSMVTDRFRVGRVLLLGDAARSFPMPVHGLNTGLQDAANLAWKLAAAVSTTDAATAATLLDTYDSERRPAAVEIRARTERVLGYGSSVPVEVIRDRLLERVFDIRTEPSPRYAPGPLTDPSGPLAGSPAPFTGRDGAGAVPPGWRLAVPCGSDGRTDPGAVAVASGFGVPVTPGPVTGEGARRLLVVRPDGYVSFDSAPDRLPALAGHLASVRRYF